MRDEPPTHVPPLDQPTTQEKPVPLSLIPPQPSAPAPAERFTGLVHSTPIIGPREGSQLIAGLVRFTPGARTNWHTHALGQALYVVDGEGFVGGRDGTVLRIRAGDTAWIPPGEEHWHGAGATSCMSHVALLQGCVDGETNVWLEPVDDNTYDAAATVAHIEAPS